MDSAFTTNATTIYHCMRFDLEDIRPINLYFLKKILFTRLGKPAFIIGERFVIEFRLTNINQIKFPGGKIKLKVQWTGEIPNWYIFDIPALSINETTDLLEGEFSVLGQGYGLILLEGEAYASQNEIEKHSDPRAISPKIYLPILKYCSEPPKEYPR